MTVLRRWFSPIAFESRRFPAPALVALAAVGAFLLAVVATSEWTHFNDEHAYWLAGARLMGGQALYDPSAVPNTPFAYWYPPPLAQIMAPLTTLASADLFSVGWTVLLLGCLWWLGGRNVFVALALIAFLPVAIELRVRNVHLLLAVLSVLALRRSPLFWVPAAAIKITPVLGVAYLAASGRWRDAAKVAVVGAVVLGFSMAISPGTWREFVEVVGARAGTDGGSLLPIPFMVRFAIGAILTIIAGLWARRSSTAGNASRGGEALLLVALTVGNPTLWVTALSILIAIVPLWRSTGSTSTRDPLTAPG